MKNQAHMTLPKETNKTPVNNPPKMKIYKLLDREFKIIILKKLNEMQDNIEN